MAADGLFTNTEQHFADVSAQPRLSGIPAGEEITAQAHKVTAIYLSRKTTDVTTVVPRPTAGQMEERGQ